ncbi:MAG: hypothetical protein LBP20_07465 [Treponema sp.]|jgi:hypothetical protein|nr:hypothetical protein [Treponema sp.]
MRKLPLAAALLAACAVCLVAQEATGTSASTALGAVSAQNRLPDIEKYADLFAAQFPRFRAEGPDWKKTG